MPVISSQFTADFTQFTSAADGAKASLEGVEQTAGKISPTLEKSAYQAGEKMAAFGKQVVAVAAEYVAAYAEQETATARLNQALENQGHASDAVKQKYADMADQFQNTTKYSEDAIVKAQTLFTEIGNVGPEQMGAALEAATNLSAGLGISLEAATRLVARAFETGGEKLGGLNKVLDEGALKGKGMAAVLEAINDKFGGQATAQTATFEGALAKLNNKMDETKETIGGLLMEGLQPLAEGFSALPEGMQSTIAGLGVAGEAVVSLGSSFLGVVSAVGPLIPLLGTGGLAGAWATLTGAFGAIAPYLGPAGIIAAGIGAWAYVFKNADVFVWAFGEAWTTLKTTIAGAYTAIVSTLENLYNALKTWLVDKIVALANLALAPVQKIVDAYQWMADKIVLHSIVPDMMNAIGASFNELPARMVEPTKAAAAAATSAFTDAMDAMNKAWIESPFNLMSHNALLVETDPGGVAHDLFGKPVTPIQGLGKTYGQQNIVVNVNGSMLTTHDQLAQVMQGAMMDAYRQGGNRVPV